MTCTHEALHKWGKALDDEMKRSLGATLMEYADSWRSEVAELELIIGQLSAENEELKSNAEAARRMDAVYDKRRKSG